MAGPLERESEKSGEIEKKKKKEDVDDLRDRGSQGVSRVEIKNLLKLN
jgi:hypothetical protein